MKTKYIVVITAFLIVVVAACQKDQYYYFNDQARLQFGPPQNGRVNNNEFLDTVKSATFFYEDASVLIDTVYFDLYTIGEVSNVDRSYSLRQVQMSNADNAVPNKHYVAFDDALATQLMVIKAGQVHAQVPIIIKRDPDLKSKTMVLNFEVVENENFKLGEKTKLWRKLYITDRLSRPSGWDAWMAQYQFGPYSVTKHKFMIDVTGEKWDQEFFVALISASDLMGYWKSVLNTALIRYNKEHAEPLKDENGEIIYFP